MQAEKSSSSMADPSLPTKNGLFSAAAFHISHAPPQNPPRRRHESRRSILFPERPRIPTITAIAPMGFFGSEHGKRYSRRNSEGSERGQIRYSRDQSNSSSGSDDAETDDYASEIRQSDDETSATKYLESANTMFSFIWWIIGFYWVSAGGETLARESPQLYWSVNFLLSGSLALALSLTGEGKGNRPVVS